MPTYNINKYPWEIRILIVRIPTHGGKSPTLGIPDASISAVSLILKASRS